MTGSAAFGAGKLPLWNAVAYIQLLCATSPTALDLGLLIVGCISAVAAGAPFPVLGILFGELVDDLNSNGCERATASGSSTLESKVLQKVLIMIYLSVANFAAIYVHTFCFSLFGERLVGRLRLRYFRNLLRQELAFHETISYGEVSGHLTASMDTIRSGTSEKVGIFISSFAYLFGAYVVAFLKVPRLAAMLVFLVPAYVILVAMGGRYIGRYTKSTSAHLVSASSMVSQALQSVQLVAALGAAERLEMKLMTLIDQARREAIKKAIVISIQFGGMFLVAYSANALAFWQGSKLIAAGSGKVDASVTTGAVYTVIFVLLDASFVVSQVAPLMQIFGASITAAQQLQFTAERQSLIDPSSSAGSSINLRTCDIRFDSVAFSYPARPNMPILRNVSLSFVAGTHTAIVGASGSGKSTIAALLSRLYDPDSGKVLIEDKDVRDLNIRHWRRSVGVVDQEPILFTCSILENIAYGIVSTDKEHLPNSLADTDLILLTTLIGEGRSESELLQSHPKLAQIFNIICTHAKTADADDFIRSLPHGYATMVGVEGSELSGGQMQRIALARALIRDPNVLILDEATSALDSATEQTVQRNLQTFRKGKTTITIAHRLATVKEADNIVVFREGNVVEQGRHEDLIDARGAYAEMIEAQAVQIIDIMPNSSPSSESSLGKVEAPVRPPHFRNASSALSFRRLRARRSRSRSQVPGHFESAQPPKSNKFMALAKLARPQLVYVILGTLGAIVAGGSYCGDAVIFGHTIGNLNPCHSGPATLSVGALAGGLFFMVAVVSFLAYITAGSCLGLMAENTVAHVRVLTFRALMRQKTEWYSSEGRSPASLLSYFTADTDSLAGLSGTVLGTLLTVATNLVASLLLTHIMAWKIAVVLLATIPILLGSGFMRLRAVSQFQSSHIKLYARSAALTLDAVRSIKTVALLGLEHHMFDRYKTSLVQPYKASLRQMLLMNFWLATAYSISTLMYALAYWWGSRLVARGDYSQTQFFIVLPALLFSAQSCGQTLALAPDVSNARSAASRLAELVDSNGTGGDLPPKSSIKDVRAAEKTEKNPDDIRDDYQQHGISIRIVDCRFSHPSRPQVPILDGLNMTIRSGQLCALIGPSGAGKSTVLSLIERFYEPDSGRIEIDEKDIRSMSKASPDIVKNQREEISYVPQDNVLFDESVHFNISLGARPGQEPTDQDIEAACRLAGIHDFITTLPDGYMTWCGDRFSGGQKQRLCIARALVRRPRLLLMDEPTSALDTESEARLQDTIERIRGSMTILIVAHRLHTIQHADQIFMLEGGRCVASGTHEELMLESEQYKANVLHQALA